ncbi:hypothetical protein QYE76_020178 [Lolium multiflorum]|uniref:F-box domain-containing protein n=1 Tax=Lolium multiflorum TaxID=4521 RepID=A0AAD8VR31_LOLMU|nr:hypothetical protein QYE76_020178 [Lolium multiflorum]
MAPPAPHLVDEILEEIFLHLTTPAALARASTACPRFRRIITQGSFLRLYRKLHPPPLLGFVADKGGFHPAQEPHPSAPLARALADAADFSYSFVPKPNNSWLTPWYARDIRDGRVLLECSSLRETDAVFTNLAVCDPLSRRHVLLPPIPEEMTVQQERLVEFEPMLAPIGEDEDETSFKVICTAHYKSKLVMFIFSSVTGQWYIAASPTWSSLGTGEPSWPCLSHFNFLRDCFYWTALWSDKLLVLDTRIMEFYIVHVLTGDHLQLLNQPHQSVCMSTVVDGTQGALEMFTLVGDYSPNLLRLHHTTQQNNSESSSEWLQKNVIALPRGCLYFTVGATEGFLFLQGVREAQWDDNLHGVLPEDNCEYIFSLEVKTFELKKVCRTTNYQFPSRVHSYFGFPPSLSKPSL